MSFVKASRLEHKIQGKREKAKRLQRDMMNTRWSGSWVWGTLFGVAAVSRTALDWFVPTQDFSARSAISTYVGVSVLLFAGFWAAWRSGSFVSGVFTVVLLAAIGAIISMAVVVVMLAVFHVTLLMTVMQGLGGLGEVLLLPIMMLLPVLILGTIVGFVGIAANKRQRLDPV